MYMSQSVSLNTTTTLNYILTLFDQGSACTLFQENALRKGDTIGHLVTTTQGSLHFIMQLC